jgi:RNA polymerase sigma factor (sigma-70 family)
VLKGSDIVEDKKIIELLFERNENGLKELTKKYDLLIKKIAYGILNNNSDTEECVNDTYLKVWSTIPPYKPDYLKPFLCKIIRQLSIDKYRFNHRGKRNKNQNISLNDLDYEISDNKNVDDEFNSKLLIEYINNFISDLDVVSQTLFIRKYFLFEETKTLSKRFNLSENYIDVKLFRVRKKLKKYLEREGYNLEKI